MRKKIIIFHLKIIVFTAVLRCSLLHGRVCVMRFGTKYHQYSYEFEQETFKSTCAASTRSQIIGSVIPDTCDKDSCF